MSTYNIYLCNPTAMRYGWRDLCFAVRDLFAPAVQGTRFERVFVQSTMHQPDVLAFELSVYVLPTQFRSLVRQHFGVQPSPRNAGLTAWDENNPAKGTLSEVYARNTSPEYLARVIYHEALHNKTRSGEELHILGGLAAGSFGADSKPTDDNTQLMRRLLSRPVRQWRNGFTSTRTSVAPR